MYYYLLMELPVLSVLTTIEKELPYKLYGAGHDYKQEETHRPFGFPVYQMLLCTEGHGILEMNGQKYPVLPGKAVILYPDESHIYYPESEFWIVSWISFGGYQLHDLLDKMNIKGTGVFDVENPKRIEDKVKQAVNLLVEQSTASRLESSVLVYSMILDCYYLFHKQGEMLYKETASILLPALRIIRNEYSRSLVLEELSNACGMSVQHFCRIFKEAIQYRPSEYINSIRITKSIELLLNHHDMKIQDIIERVGFKSESYFCSVFKKQEGVTPGQFRKRHLRND
jgi:AraC family transcriptional regulator, arabinose operon regulatory protein